MVSRAQGNVRGAGKCLEASQCRRDGRLSGLCAGTFFFLPQTQDIITRVASSEFGDIYADLEGAEKLACMCSCSHARLPMEFSAACY